MKPLVALTDRAVQEAIRRVMKDQLQQRMDEELKKVRETLAAELVALCGEVMFSTHEKAGNPFVNEISIILPPFRQEGET